AHPAIRTDVFRSATTGGTIDLVSVTPSGAVSATVGFCGNPSISEDGRFVAFSATSSDIVANDTNGKEDVFRRDMTLTTNSTIRVSVGITDVNGNANNSSTAPSISADGNRIA